MTEHYSASTAKSRDCTESQTSRTVISTRCVARSWVDDRYEDVPALTSQSEFERMRLTYNADGVSMPLRSDLKKKHEDIKALRDRAMTNVSHPCSPLG